MSKNSGILFPPLVGYSFNALLRVLRISPISYKYFFRVFFIVLINLINLPFRIYERVFINPRFESKELENPPVFIIGHWRSGTTHLHNLLSQDKQMGYVTTYQSVFPDTLFNILGKWLFKGFMQLLIPNKRAGDNVILHPDLPQEEEFALGHKVPLSYYLFWFFPKRSIVFFMRCLKLEEINTEHKSLWKSEFRTLIQKALRNTKGKVFLSKNPPNTGRIETILEMFPNAKFIHIHRNPIDVYLSTMNFFRNMMPHLRLEDINTEELSALVIDGYKRLMKEYIKTKALIPSQNLYELSFSELESNPITCLENIYKELKIEKYEEAKVGFENYITAKRNYKKNKLAIDKPTLDLVSSEWAFMMERYNYEIPTYLEIK